MIRQRFKSLGRRSWVLCAGQKKGDRRGGGGFGLRFDGKVSKRKQKKGTHLQLTLNFKAPGRTMVSANLPVEQGLVQ